MRGFLKLAVLGAFVAAFLVMNVVAGATYGEKGRDEAAVPYAPTPNATPSTVYLPAVPNRVGSR